MCAVREVSVGVRWSPSTAKEYATKRNTCASMNVLADLKANLRDFVTYEAAMFLECEYLCNANLRDEN